MGRVDKGEPCSAQGCKNQAERSISKNNMSGSDLKIGGEGRRVYLCRDHYKQWKKATKDSRSLERARFG